ncbi:MAG: carboxylating nicotinate-nucleotide diphosphorylase [Myxococcaceae bacterium]|nr:MAG: carboxylating nicotinate-nucleotide diphosphorylase [Myxococcaceae bacterium]
MSLDEDLGAAGDVTSLAVVPADAEGSGELVAKEQMIIAGLDAFVRVFHMVDAEVEVEVLKQDGNEIKPKVVAARVHGKLRSLLAAERTALNLVQRAAGIATLAQQAVTAVRGSKLRVLDTRKTPPGMRGLAKHAVRMGGASNHRFGLFDGILIKDNHIASVGGDITEAIRRAKLNGPRLVKIEVEVTNFKQLAEAIAAGADVIMLDNMDDAQIREAAKLTAGRVPLEVSGGVTLDRLPRLAKLGVDFVSMGALTHSARAMDLSLEIQTTKKATRKPRAASQG